MAERAAISARSSRDATRPEVLAVTMGDPAGIGIDITLKAWNRRAELQLPPFAFFADSECVAQRACNLGISVPVREIETAFGAADIFHDHLPVCPVHVAKPVKSGVPDALNAAAVIGAIEEAVEAVVRGEAAAVVTNPIAKSVLYTAGFTHPGHTEFLGALAERHWPGRRFHPVMMLASTALKVVPLTVHIPLADVPGAITRVAIFETVRITHEALKRDFGIVAPRIVVAGLNPHAGEGGAIGREERDVIAPAVKELQHEGLAISGPASADTLFHAAARQTYDVVIAMYHDQALIPLKTLAFDEGVNVTLGLPFVRTSPDHGTAFEIAGTGRANPESFIQSLKLAATMAAARAAGTADA